ncbi:MAG: DNA polymerase I [Clostridia bacterium]|nr:DNA polymerase I [Clostridia bacterium]
MRLLVLDGNSILNRAFYGIKLLTTKDGLFTNGIYGFLTMLGKIESDTAPDATAIAFDMHAPTFRHKAYDGYKAKRRGMPDELAQQMPLLKELLHDLGYKTVECEGFEADDILGTLAAACEKNDNECVIATGDRDSLQLVTEKTFVRLVTTKFGQTLTTLYTPEKVKEDYGVTPRQMIDLKAIQGDSSDNIPGVAGIGPKGATELISSFGTLDGVYENLDSEAIKPTMRKKLSEGKDSAYLSYFLGTIVKNAPVDLEVEHYRRAPVDLSASRALMTKLELFSLMEKLLPGESEIPESVMAAAELPEVLRYEDGAAVLTKLYDFGRADFVYESDETGIVRFLFMIDKTIFDVRCDDAFFRAFCVLPIPKRTVSVKALYKAADDLGTELRNVSMDLELAAYLINPSSNNYSPLRLAAQYGLEIPLFDDERCREAAVISALSDRLISELRENNQEKLFFEIELPLARVLAAMEHTGFAVDRAGIAAYGEKLKSEISALQEEIWSLSGCTFNINSPKQLGETLFEKLHLPHGKKTKSGYSTNADVLENLRYDHPVVDAILRYRALTKLNSTYCEGLLKVVSADGRIHSNFNQTETRTGRISSTEPNLQNIPVRTAQGRELRRFFIAKEGCVLVDADYSQIELRVLAHVAGDENMIESFRRGEDIHRSTAAQVFGMPEEMVSPEMRSRAKAVNFGIVYGIGAFSLSKDIGVSRKEAERYIENYLAHFSKVREYLDRSVALARDRGYAETIFHRRRYLQELSSSNFNLRSFGERVAKNMPIQGAAADIIKIAMIRVYDRLKKEGLRAQLILQVHDELIVEAPEEEAEKTAAILTEEMENAVSLRVPMIADSSVGKTWFDAKG